MGTAITTISDKLPPFTEAHEGRVHTAYRDSGGVWTIGIGFTMLDPIFSAYWLQSRGHALRAGDTITDAECDMLLTKLLNGTYLPPVLKRFANTPGLLQQHVDGSTDMSYNCGGGSLKWSWATALAKGDIATAASLLRTTAITAGGRRLAGLVTRRSDEAKVIELGDYGVIPATKDTAPSVSTSSADVMTYQRQLAALGFSVTVDGNPATTRSSVIAYQVRKGMIADGIVGPATRAALGRDVAAKNAKTATTTTAVATGSGSVVATGAQTPAQAHFDWGTLVTYGKWAIIATVAVFAIFMLWRFRGVILHKRTPA